MNRHVFPFATKSILHISQIIIVLLFVFYSRVVYAQSVTLSGTARDVKGEAVLFASIKIKGTTWTTTTDVEGKFTITTHLPATIVCSAVGYDDFEKEVKQSDFKDSVAKIDIVLNRTTKELATVVVTALGSVRQSTFPGYTTASVSNKSVPSSSASGRKSVRRDAAVDEAFLADRTALDYTSISPGLSGKVSGLTVTTTSTGIRAPGKTEIKTREFAPVTLNTRRSRLLTAGELNDFKKWEMWEDYNQDEFKMHSEKWQLYATDRYCVQLQNQEKKAVVDEKVFLINKTTGDTLWTAVSDNTGKAELWNDFTKKTNNKDLKIVVNNEIQQFAAIPFVQGINQVVINRSCAVSGKVDIAFVVDATGSMQDEINYLKEELEDVLEKIKKKDSTLDLRTGAVFYRDNGDDYVTKVQELTNGINNTTGFIKKQDAGGGGDFPEAVNEGLKQAIQNLEWNKDARVRIAFLLMDAPPHDEAREEMATLVLQAAAKGIRIVPVACSGTDKATEFIMRSIALATNGSYLFLTDDSGIGNSHIKPTTDEFKVELLNDILQRTIEQMCYVNDCAHNSNDTEPIVEYKNIENVKVFPNPTSGPVTIKTTTELKEIFIADFTGKLLRRIQVNKKSGCRFDLSAFPSGTYFIKYATEKNTTGTEKLVLIK